jgi:hypothetical protein
MALGIFGAATSQGFDFVFETKTTRCVGMIHPSGAGAGISAAIACADFFNALVVSVVLPLIADAIALNTTVTLLG